MNRCIFIGRLTRDPEVTYSEKAEMSVARFTVAVDRIVKKEGEPDADFINCVAFDKKAEFVEQYWYSGMRVAVSGKIQNENYTNRNGEKVYSVSLKADDVEFADGKREAASGKEPMQNAVPPKASTPANTAAPSAPRTAAPAPRTAAPAKPAASRNVPQRQTPGRSAVGRSASQRGAASPAAGDQFMNVASGMEEGLPFN